MLRRGTRALCRHMASIGNKQQVQHDVQNKVFFISLADASQAQSQDDSRAILEYESLTNGALDLYHTEVPHALRGQGIAALLVKAAFEHCVTNNLKMKLSCTYVQKYYDEHKLPEYTRLVVE